VYLQECEARVCDLLGLTTVECNLPDNHSPEPTAVDETPPVSTPPSQARNNNGLWMIVAALVILFISIATWAVLNA